MDKYDKLMWIVIFIILFIGVWGMIDITKEHQKPEIEQAKYTENTIINDLSIETYNRSYKDLNNSEKEHIIRMYRIKDYFTEENTKVTPMPIFIPT